RLAQAAQREIADRKRAEEALRDLNVTLEQQILERTQQLRDKEQALRQSQKMEAVGQLTGGIAHDFNNLLQVIVGNLESLQRHLPKESGRLRRSATQAMNGALRAAALTQRLLAFARRQPLDPKPVDVNVLVKNASELMYRSLGEVISIETVLSAGLWRVEVDANELEAALLNLAVNARDAMPEGGKLTIETSNTHIDEAYSANHVEVIPGQYVVICVSDTGSGMTEETVAQAFEPFFTTKPVGKGTGLGLSQVYGFIKQSGGHVKIYSEVGEGTTVKLYLPRLVGDQAQADDELDASPDRGSEEVILVVEDDDDVRTYSVEALHELGYTVLEAMDGRSALELMQANSEIALLFTDVVMPGMTGRELANKAVQLHRGLKLLFSTGYTRNAIVHNGVVDAGTNFLQKPYSLNDLARKIRRILDAGGPSTPG